MVGEQIIPEYGHETKRPKLNKIDEGQKTKAVTTYEAISSYQCQTKTQDTCLQR